VLLLEPFNPKCLPTSLFKGSKLIDDIRATPGTWRKPTADWSCHLLSLYSYKIYSPSQVVMGPGQNFLTHLGQFFVAQVESGQPSLVWIWFWNISPENPKFFNFFPCVSKNLVRSKSTGERAGWPLIYCGSKVCSYQVGSRPISTDNQSEHFVV